MSLPNRIGQLLFERGTVKTAGVIGGFRVGEKKRIRAREICGDGLPSKQIRGSLDDRQAMKTQSRRRAR